MANGLQFLGNVATGIAGGIQTAQSIQANQQKLEASELELKQRKEEQGARADLKEHLGAWITRSNNVGRQNDDGVKEWASQPTTRDTTPDTTSGTTPDTTVVKDPGEYAGGGAAFSVIDEDGNVKPSSQWSYEAKASYYKWQRRKADSALNTLIGTYSILSPGDTLTIQKELKAELESKDSARMMGILAEAQSLVNGVTGAQIESSYTQGVTSDELIEGGLNSLTSLINSNREFLQLPGTSTSVDMTGGEIRLLNTDGDRVTALRLDEFEKLVVDKNINLIGDAIKKVEDRRARKLELASKTLTLSEQQFDFKLKEEMRPFALTKAEQEAALAESQAKIAEIEADDAPDKIKRIKATHKQELEYKKAMTGKAEADAQYGESSLYKAAQKIREDLSKQNREDIFEIDRDVKFAGDILKPDQQSKVDGYLPIYDNVMKNTSDINLVEAGNNRVFAQGAKEIHDTLYTIDKNGNVNSDRAKAFMEGARNAGKQEDQLRYIEEFLRKSNPKFASVIAEPKMTDGKPSGIIVNFKTPAGANMALDLEGLLYVHGDVYN